jgi:DNA repair exonuclease SbcCD nuclease subunit
LFKVTEESDVVFDTGHLGLDRVQYVALGHIHKPQSLPGLPHVRYCGSLDHLHFDERDNETGVVLVEIGPMGLVRDPEVLPLQPTAMHALTIADPATELVGLAECVPDRDNTLVKIQATYIPGGPTRDEIIRAIRVAFPRYTEINWVKAETGDSTGRTAGIKPAADHRATVREFLTRELKDDPGRDALLKLAEEFLTTETKS